MDASDVRQRPAICDTWRMCFNGEQILNNAILAGAALLLGAMGAPAGAVSQAQQHGETAMRSAGGVAVGEGNGGITDRAYVSAPPNYVYVVEKERGSFLDCGAGKETRATDGDGRDMAGLRCGVTLTETIVIPAAAESARIIVHY